MYRRRENTEGAITAAAVEAWNAGDRMALHRALGLRPWQVSPLDATGDCPHPDDTAGARSWPKAAALREELTRAAG